MTDLPGVSKKRKPYISAIENTSYHNSNTEVQAKCLKVISAKHGKEIFINKKVMTSSVRHVGMVFCIDYTMGV